MLQKNKLRDFIKRICRKKNLKRFSAKALGRRLFCCEDACSTSSMMLIELRTINHKLQLRLLASEGRTQASVRYSSVAFRAAVPRMIKDSGVYRLVQIWSCVRVQEGTRPSKRVDKRRKNTGIDGSGSRSGKLLYSTNRL